MRFVNGLPIFSTSEEVAYKCCKLAHSFQYIYGYQPVVTNRKLSTGIGVHAGLEAYYLGGGPEDIAKALEAWEADRWQEMQAAGIDEHSEAVLAFATDRDLMRGMVAGYIAWVKEEGIDQGYRTEDVEAQHYVQVPGAPCLLPIKIDLLQRHRASGLLRIVDFKTAASFSADTTKYQLAEQNGNYQLGVLAVYGERPTELAYRELKKMTPELNPKSKPPFFREVRVVLTAAEMRHRMAEYAKTADERFKEEASRFTNPDDLPVANPSMCCGSWRADWQAPCLKVHQGMSITEALETSDGYQPGDPYDRYDEKEQS